MHYDGLSITTRFLCLHSDNHNTCQCVWGVIQLNNNMEEKCIL